MTQPVNPPRHVRLERTAQGRYTATNEAGATIEFGHAEDLFSPVELLLAAVAGCSAIDVDYVTGKRAEPTAFTVEAAGAKSTDEWGGHKLGSVDVNFTVSFPDTEEGDAAAAVVERTVAQSRDRLCTVSRTLALPTPVTFRVAGEEVR